MLPAVRTTLPSAHLCGLIWSAKHTSYKLQRPPAQTARQQLMLLCIVGDSHAQWPARGTMNWVLSWLLCKESCRACPAEPALQIQLAVTCPLS